MKTKRDIKVEFLEVTSQDGQPGVRVIVTDPEGDVETEKRIATAIGTLITTIEPKLDQLTPVEHVDEIKFYRANEKLYGAFSNLYRRAIEFEGRTFASSEHAYQFGKPRRAEVRDWLMAAPSPGLLAKAAHQLAFYDIVPGWSRTKLARMLSVLRAKFTQHEDLRELLLGTGHARLVEAGTINDKAGRYWGEVNGRGSNHLGFLLMQVREELRIANRSE